MQETKQRVPHQSDTPTLRCGAEINDLELAVLNIPDVFHDCAPRWIPNRILVIVEGYQLCSMSRVHLYVVPKAE